LKEQVDLAKKTNKVYLFSKTLTFDLLVGKKLQIKLLEAALRIN